jgi:peptidoglycan/LPS O-acetylase OafA/YrhL
MAVFLFFTLSGFWIRRMWAEKYSTCRGPTKTFYVSRIWRLLPAFWAANLLALLIATAHGKLPAEYRVDLVSWHSIRLLVGNIILFGYASLPRSSRILDTAWSLDVEIQFYLVFPLLILLPRRLRNVILVAAGSVGLFLICVYGEPIHRNIAFYVAFFAIGMWAEDRKWRPTQNLALVGLALAAVGGGLCLAMPQTRGLFIAPAHITGGLFKWMYAANCGMALLLLPFGLRTTAMPSDRLDRILGDLSYMVYLFHLPMIALILESGRHSHLGLVQHSAYLAIAWLATFAISVLFWRFVHLPLDKRRRSFVSWRESLGGTGGKTAEERSGVVESIIGKPGYEASP